MFQWSVTLKLNMVIKKGMVGEMSDLRKAANEVLEAWGWDISEPRNKILRERMEALRQALAQPDEVLAEREAVLETIDELIGSERDRHPMFSDGYDYALQNIDEFVRAR